jgi:hypothetical protein
MKIEHADSPDKITGCVQLGSICDELMEHFSSLPPKHVHIVVHVPPMCEYSRHPFMLPNFLIDAPLFLHCRSLYIFINVACRLIPPLSPFIFFLQYPPISPCWPQCKRSISSYMFPSITRAFSKATPAGQKRNPPYTPPAYDTTKIYNQGYVVYRHPITVLFTSR